MPDPDRSPHWPAARAAHLRAEPACRACGGTAHLEVHHVRPFHLFPLLELDPANLVTLCESPGHNCHLTFGHCYSWDAWNLYVREDADTFLSRLRESRSPTEPPCMPSLSPSA